MVVLPIERIQKHLGRSEGQGLADDRALDHVVAKEVARIFGDGTAESPGISFAESPIFQPAAWSYAFSPKPFNIADGLPGQVARALNQPAAEGHAAERGAREMMLVLRNALAHGGVLYLDQHGHSTEGARAEFMAFVGEKRATRQLVGLHVLRISEGHFRECLGSWVSWLSGTGLSRDLAA
jgi:hypothetical protein